MVWPLQLKFTGDLEEKAIALLEAVLMEANMGREKKILKGYRRYHRPGVHPSSLPIMVPSTTRKRIVWRCAASRC
jgi:hypothetical protein